MHVAVVHNPDAGDGATSREQLESAISRQGHTVNYWDTRRPDWTDAFCRTYDLVVAAGGDGTVGNVITHAVGKDVTVAVLPLGTANNIARALGLPVDLPLGLIETWVRGRTVLFDVPQAGSGAEARRFVEDFAGGFLASFFLAADGPGADDGSHDGLWNRFLAAVSKTRSAPWTIAVDGRDISTDCIGVHAMNIPTVGPVLPLAPDADPSDGLLDVVLVRSEDVEVVERYARDRKSHAAPTLRSLTTVRGRRVTAVPPSDHELALDDSVVPRERPGARWSVELDGVHATVLVPATPGGQHRGFGER
jgi:diacylglycerol kinase family enzyme